MSQAIPLPAPSSARPVSATPVNFLVYPDGQVVATAKQHPEAAVRSPQRRAESAP